MQTQASCPRCSCLRVARARAVGGATQGAVRGALAPKPAKPRARLVWGLRGVLAASLPRVRVRGPAWACSQGRDGGCACWGPAGASSPTSSPTAPRVVRAAEWGPLPTAPSHGPGLASLASVHRPGRLRGRCSGRAPHLPSSCPRPAAPYPAPEPRPTGLDGEAPTSRPAGSFWCRRRGQVAGDGGDAALGHLQPRPGPFLWLPVLSRGPCRRRTEAGWPARCPRAASPAGGGLSLDRGAHLSAGAGQATHPPPIQERPCA